MKKEIKTKAYKKITLTRALNNYTSGVISKQDVYQILIECGLMLPGPTIILSRVTSEIRDVLTDDSLVIIR